MARLGDVVKISPSTAPLTGEQHWLLNLDMVEQQTGRIIAYNYVDADELDGSIIQFDTDAVLYSKLRPNLNKVVLPDQPGFSTSEMLPLVPDTAVLTREYLTCFLRSDSFVTWAVSKTAGAKMPRLGSKELLGKEIPLPSIAEQGSIAQQFAKVDALISLRKQQIAKLDELVKARFVEMFGEPAANPMKWKLMRITDVCDDICGGGTPSKSHPEYYEGKIPWVSPKDMKSLVISDSIDHITEAAIENSTARLIPANSVLMVIRSGILKHTLPVAINNVPVTVNQDMKAFMPGKEITASYLMYYFKAIESDVLSGVRAVTADNIDFKAFQKRSVMVPPLSLQHQFAAFVAQTNQQKLTIQHSLEKMETLKKALMQKYFG